MFRSRNLGEDLTRHSCVTEIGPTFMDGDDPEAESTIGDTSRISEDLYDQDKLN